MKQRLKNRAADLIQKALNAYLALDPESHSRLQSLQGKSVTVELVGMNFIFHLAFTENEIQLGLDAAQNPDTLIKGTPLRLLHLTLTPSRRKQFFADDVSMEGNLELGQQIIDLFDHLEIDWEEHLSRWVGDVPAHHFSRMARRLKSWSDKTRETLLQDVNEFVHEEVKIFPPAEALNDFFHDVDLLRMDTDRIEVRIKQLQKTLNAMRGLV